VVGEDTLKLHRSAAAV